VGTFVQGGARRALVILAALACLGNGPAERPRELRVSAIPDEGRAELEKKFAPLGAYLEKKLGMKVTYVPAPDYAYTVESLAKRRIDLVWYGGFTFVQARRRTGTAIPIVHREHDGQFHTKIIVPASSPAKTLEDLKRRDFAFGSISSTSGHLMPRFFLTKNGIDPEKDFTRVAYSGAHDTTVKWVEAGRVDAGAVNESVLQKMLEEKRVDRSKIRVLWTTPAYADYNWTVRGDLDPKLVEQIRDAFLALDAANPEHKVILDLQRTRKFVRTTSSNYDGIEEAAKAARLIRQSQ
jgi:phosphonate transport system substrate-binding protein